MAAMTLHRRARCLPGNATTALAASVALLVSLLAATPAQAQYKVVGPDGKITYTDRPAAVPGAQVQPLRPSGSSGTSGTAGGNPAPPAALPAELRPLVARFPVRLYTSADCAPCEAGRKLLQQRGVPFNERSVSSDDDIAALARLTGGRSVPALTIGGQALRGFQEADWQSTLDLAGYPRTSRLPSSYQAPASAPLVTRSAVEAPAATAQPAPSASPADSTPTALPAAAGGIRF